MKAHGSSFRVALFASLVFAIAVGCGSSFSNEGGKDSGADHAECQGTAPDCFNTSSSACCLVNAYGPATCTQGAWTCGAVTPPGCDESISKCGGPSCVGAPPRCCAVKDGACDCAPQPPFQFATCGTGAVWICGQDEVLESACGSDGGSGFGEASVPDVSIGMIEAGPPDFDVIPIHMCGSRVCGMTRPICVETLTEGTFCVVPIKGVCGPGEVLFGSCCASTSFSCAERPMSCGAIGVDCACAKSLCPSAPTGGTSQCEKASGDDVECYVTGSSIKAGGP
jgi:hypothetical protein